jgi:hypothetical protein
VLKALEYGLRPLAVTAMTDQLTGIGWRNLNNISKLGVDHVSVQVNQRLRRKINKLALTTVGDISWPEHVLIFTVPIREALLRDISLILYGECPENEYGGPWSAQNAPGMGRPWLEEFGGLNGLRVSDLAELVPASPRELFQYTYPQANKMPKTAFLGYYFPWDGQHNAVFAQKHGFEWAKQPVSGTFVTWENLDNAQTGVHDFFKYLKFGFGRATDHACNAIRRGRLTREKAIELVNEYDGQMPYYYVDTTLLEIIESIGMTEQEWWECCWRFANPALFQWTVDNQLIKKFRVGQDD